MTHHGEYKVPGGKLVKVDFAVSGDALREVVVSGDFFLYPEETLEDIRGALEGLPAATSEVAIAERIRVPSPAARTTATHPRSTSGNVFTIFASDRACFGRKA